MRVRPLVVLYNIYIYFFFRTHLAPVGSYTLQMHILLIKLKKTNILDPSACKCDCSYIVALGYFRSCIYGDIKKTLPIRPCNLYRIEFSQRTYKHIFARIGGCIHFLNQHNFQWVRVYIMFLPLSCRNTRECADIKERRSIPEERKKERKERFRQYSRCSQLSIKYNSCKL